jgi:hypothetical protein
MKHRTGIWIDSTRAIIVNLQEKNADAEIKEIQSNMEEAFYDANEGDKGSFMGQQHIRNGNKFDNKEDQQINQFLDNVISNIKETDELYIFGPAEAKTKLKSKIEAAGQKLKFELKAVETSDSMTLNQVVAKVKEFYS